jgi:hypothetical protein
MTAPLVNVSEDVAHWYEFVVGNFESEDTSPDKIVTRTAHRIASKGFELLHIVKSYRATEAFAWGRSSDAKVLKEQWEIGFANDEGGEFAMLVRVDTCYQVNKRNPYDKKGPSTKPSIGFIPKDRESRKALGMKDPE